MTQVASETVLLIRVNSSTELLSTSSAVDQVRAAFPQARLITLATPQTETRSLVQTDRRFDEVLLFPNDAETQTKSAGAFRRFMARQRITASVVCFGATPGFDYSRHLLSVLLCPGKRYFMDGQGRLFRVGRPRGIHVLLGAVSGLMSQKIVLPALRALSSRKLANGRPISQGVRRILVIRLDHLGDVAMSLATIHALKEHFREAQIDALVGSAPAALLQDVLDIDEVIVCDAPRFSRSGSRQGLRDRLSVLRRLRHRAYDLAIDLRGDDTSRLWAQLSGAKQRAGFAVGPYEPPNQANLSLLLTHPIMLSAHESAGRHAVELGLELVRRLGVPMPAESFRLAVAPACEQAVTSKLRQADIRHAYGVLHIKPGNPAKEWSVASFAAVADHLVEVHHLDVLLSGAPDDWEVNEEVLSQVQHATRVYNVAGRFPLAELPALFAAARILVTVDTGPMHIAAAVGTPLVSPFLPWSVTTFHPYGQLDAAVTPHQSGLEALEASGRLWDGRMLDAITAAEICDAVDRKLVSAYA